MIINWSINFVIFSLWGHLVLQVCFITHWFLRVYGDMYFLIRMNYEEPRNLSHPSSSIPSQSYPSLMFPTMYRYDWSYLNLSKIRFFVFHENPFLIDVKSWIFYNQSFLGPAPLNLLDGLLYEQNYLSHPTYFFSYRPIGLNTFTFSISPSFR